MNRIPARILLPIIMGLVFILENTVSFYFARTLFYGETRFIPHFIIVMLVMMVVYLPRNQVMIYALVLGLVYDIYNIGIIGIYFALFPVVVYISQKLLHYLQGTFIMILLVSIFGVAISEFGAYLIFSSMKSVSIAFLPYVTTRLTTTLLFNIAYFLIIYFPFMLLLKRWKRETKGLSSTHVKL
ncbi:rod shape-determining protein MreD [Brochothrix thermosphacta]|uniref:rod shape-determining protein MreD n=1 Tax=Brochothrix thermosphacta TaxID=2756 RepID=UPI00068753F6|nr:rod shape-determining protein MreD [Brochothrix thermosphacta]ODJ48055.1 rod shape-determining protein MreD [Brochothrix thermosphacta DSM 20171 = FSL F6-1036]